MPLSSQKMIQSAAESLRRDHPKFFGVLSAILHTRNLSEARRACNYPSPEDFASDFHQAIEHLFKQLRDLGYVPPSKTDSFEEHIGQIAPSSHFKLPSREIINRFYKGHIFHEACALVAKQNHLGLSKLWERFPNRRQEIEIAIALTPIQPLQPRSIRLSSAPIQRPQQRFLPALAGAFALGIVLLLALSPPQGGRAYKAIVTNFEEMLVSAQGIFDMNKSTREEASITKSEPEPQVQAAPEPASRPKIALPDKPKLALASLPDIPRQLDKPLGRSLGGLKTPPRVLAPDLDRGANPSSFFGSRPEVHVARATMSMPAPAPTTLPSTGASTGKDQPEQHAESAGLKGYRPAGRIGFSTFHTSAGLSAELVRLTRIQRALSRLKTPQNRIYENAQLTLAPDRARIQFADGVAFILTFRLGQLDDIRIFARSGIDKTLHIETEVRRGILLLNRALSNT